jgi:dCMP deaminase
VTIRLDETAPDARPTWDEQFLEMAALTARRSTCHMVSQNRKPPVGCIITLNNRIVTSGYNGSLPGGEHCVGPGGVGHDFGLGPGLEPGHRCKRAVHAEQNAIADAAKRGVSVDGGVAYVTRVPCWACLKLLIAAGIGRIVCARDYKNAEKAGAFAFEHRVIFEWPQADGEAPSPRGW